MWGLVIAKKKQKQKRGKTASGLAQRAAISGSDPSERRFFTRDCKRGKDCWNWPGRAGGPAGARRSRGTWKCEWRRHDQPAPSTGPIRRDCTAIPPRRTRAKPRNLPSSRSGRDVTGPPDRDGLATKHLPSASREWPSIQEQRPNESVAVATLWSVPLPVEI